MSTQGEQTQGKVTLEDISYIDTKGRCYRALGENFTGFSGASLDPIEGVEYEEVKVPPIKWRNDVTKKPLTLGERSDDLEKQRVRSINAGAYRRHALREKEKKKAAAEAQTPTQAETAQSEMGDDEMASSSSQPPDYTLNELYEWHAATFGKVTLNDISCIDEKGLCYRAIGDDQRQRRRFSLPPLNNRLP
ncbi:hypothetical protein I350_01023 [Cryptococcus amylolentus CBS 6273]|uniref:Uncharacterized protein n=1 Tax=Cryptococcus amylolentus CBS 6273 TaxID=1296118 RepID=A0A1E3KBD5_9TREE|nr:hypothetical protein I350_01023 [Cryptococcus amylolentus CBS 6273]